MSSVASSKGWVAAVCNNGFLMDVIVGVATTFFFVQLALLSIVIRVLNLVAYGGDASFAERTWDVRGVQRDSNEVEQLVFLFPVKDALTSHELDWEAIQADLNADMECVEVVGEREEVLVLVARYG